jgi:hypothetical protein
MGLARFAVKVIHPAGIKNVKFAIFEELAHAPAGGDNTLNALMRNALPNTWQPLMRMRSRNGEQMYVYATEEDNSIKLMVVNIEGTDAFVARVQLNPDKLREFLADPKVLGISLK